MKCVREGLGWILRKGSSPRGWLDTALSSPGMRPQKPDRVQDVFGQDSQAHGVILQDGPVQCQDLDYHPCGSLLPEDNLRFYDSVVSYKMTLSRFQLSALLHISILKTEHKAVKTHLTIKKNKSVL